MKISNKLLNKYNVAVPRYTSYPPANFFTNAFTESDYVTLIEQSNAGNPEHIALYIHIPFCKKICFYCGCNACNIGDGKWVVPYFKALRIEMERVGQKLDRSRKVSQIHYGGGTPNAVDVSFLAELNQYFFSTFTFIDHPEIAIECNPAYLDEPYIKALKAAGFNRFSLGIQDFDKEVLRGVNRDSSQLPVAELIRLIKADKPEIGVNLDFIYGLPGQTVESFTASIRAAIELRPDRLVTFSYAHVPWMKKHQVALEKKGLPDPELKMQMYWAAHELLLEAGYLSLGLDHYVLPDDELARAMQSHQLHRNFQGYCTRRTTGQVYAFGVSAISQLDGGYAQNEKEIPQYLKGIESGGFAIEKGCLLSDEQRVIREVITELMCNKKLVWEHIAQTIGLSVSALKQMVNYPEQQLAEFAADGLLTYTHELIEVTETGTYFIRNIAAAFDKYYQQQSNTYSKSV